MCGCHHEFFTQQTKTMTNKSGNSRLHWKNCCKQGCLHQYSGPGSGSRAPNAANNHSPLPPDSRRQGPLCPTTRFRTLISPHTPYCPTIIQHPHTHIYSVPCVSKKITDTMIPTSRHNLPKLLNVGKFAANVWDT